MKKKEYVRGRYTIHWLPFFSEVWEESQGCGSLYISIIYVSSQLVRNAHMQASQIKLFLSFHLSLSVPPPPTTSRVHTCCLPPFMQQLINISCSTFPLGLLLRCFYIYSQRSLKTRLYLFIYIRTQDRQNRVVSLQQIKEGFSTNFRSNKRYPLFPGTSDMASF